MAPLTADAKRLRTIIVAFPIFVATSAILYRRTYLGEEQRKAPSRTADPGAGDNTILQHGAVGGTPWVRQGENPDKSR